MNARLCSFRALTDIATDKTLKSSSVLWDSKYSMNTFLQPRHQSVTIDVSVARWFHGHTQLRRMNANLSFVCFTFCYYLRTNLVLENLRIRDCFCFALFFVMKH